MSWRGFARKACAIEKILGAKQKSGLKPPPLLMDSPILAIFLLNVNDPIQMVILNLSPGTFT